jgi:hypothetical protein
MFFEPQGSSARALAMGVESRMVGVSTYAVLIAAATFAVGTPGVAGTEYTVDASQLGSLFDSVGAQSTAGTARMVRTD